MQLKAFAVHDQGFLLQLTIPHLPHLHHHHPDSCLHKCYTDQIVSRAAELAIRMGNSQQLKGMHIRHLL